MTIEPTIGYTTRLDDLTADDLALAGGKGANLGELVGAGLPVPSGFVVTTDAYRALIDDPAIREAIEMMDSLDPVEDALTGIAADLRDLIREREFDEAIEVSVLDALDTDTDATDGTTYSVRSSATAEDLPTASFAGQHETFLGVPEDGVLDRVRECMTSLFTDRAVAYRARNDISHTDVAMAVVVQPMVDAEVAGVLFTADPDTGNRTVASIDATYGLGDTVVSGEVNADNARVDKETGKILDYEVGQKATELRLADNGEDDGTTTEATEERRKARALSDERLGTLVELGTRIEALFGEPQDVEWALVDRSFRILQSRPITSLFPVPESQSAIDDNRLHVYFNAGIEQGMIEAVPPLAVDVWEVMYDVSALLLLGIEDARAYTAPAGGRLYVDITPLLGIERIQRGLLAGFRTYSEPAAAGLQALLDNRSEEFPGPSLSSLPPVVRFLGGMIRHTGPLVASSILVSVRSLVRAGGDADKYREWYEVEGEKAAAELRDSDSLRARVERVFGTGVDYASFEYIAEGTSRVMPIFVSVWARSTLESMFPEKGETIDAAGRGHPDEVGTRMTLRLGDLADTARTYPAVEEAIEAGQSLDEIASVDGGEQFRTEFEAFLDEFGHRATNEIDVSQLRWRENPTNPLATIRSYLTTGEKGAHRDRLGERQRNAKVAFDHLLDEASSGLAGPIRRRLVRHLLRTYRGYIQLRDEPKQGFGYVFAAWHDVLKEAGERLADEGVLDDSADVWFLHREELFALLDGETSDVPDIDGRRQAFERYVRMDAPPLMTSEGEVPRPVIEDDLDDDTLTGTGVSAGVVEGVARVVHDPGETTLESGEIVVAPSCGPGWTPLFANAGGLVTEAGGRMTHGALVAREYGLPAVVSVLEATDAIENGQRIRVDGTTGTVEVLDANTEE